jgi:hypothetical protein
MAWDYFQAGGDVDFLLPDSPEFSDWLGGLNLDIDISKGDEWSYTRNEDGSIDITWDLPSIDIDGEGDFNLPDVPDVLECMEGWDWSDLYEECVEITDVDLPDVLECMEGFDWDGQQCVEIPDFFPNGTDCEEGFNWDSLLGQCVEISVDVPDILPEGTDCEEGFNWDSLLGQCVEISIPTPEVEILDCMEGWEWSDLYEECVEIDINIPTPEVDVLDCMEGWDWSDLYEQCVQVDFEIPEWETPELPEFEWDMPDIELPDLPDLPEPTAPTPKQASKHEFTPTQQFAYTDVKGYTAPAKRQTHDYIKGKGLLK